MPVDNLDEKKKLISKEVRRLSGIYKSIEEKRKKTIEGLIQRAAFLRITLEELEEDINIYGVTEWFSQGDQEPYQRERPTARIYNTMNTNYQKITKQLTDLLPKDGPKQESGDAFEDF